MRTRQVVSRQVDLMSSARELIKWGEQELAAQVADPSLDALLLLGEACDLSRTNVLAQDAVLREHVERFESFIARRKVSEPIQYITGRAYFRQLTLAVGPGVLIPRPESENLVSDVMSKIAHLSEPKVLDLGAGSGALALSIALELPGSRVTAVEKDRAALAWLRKNVNSLSADIEILETDVSDFAGGAEWDAVIANPPYIPQSEALPFEVAKFEPGSALFGGSLGIEVPRLFIDAAARALKPHGYLAIEHHESQGGAIADALSQYFNNVELHYDLNGRPRWSSGVRK